MSQYLLHQVWVSDRNLSDSVLGGKVSIPSSSGMGVGRMTFQDVSKSSCLNTFFIRYGCRTHLPERRISCIHVSIPSSSGMGVGRSAR